MADRTSRNLRTDTRVRITAIPGYMTVAGPTSQAIAACCIQQTYELLRQNLPPELQRRDLPQDRIRFTSFVGINLLRAWCGLPAHNAGLSYLDTHNIGIPEELAASSPSFLPSAQSSGPITLPVVTASPNVHLGDAREPQTLGAQEAGS